MQWCERNLCFDFSKAKLAIKFDNPEWHGVTHGGLCAADFLVEWDDQLWLIEIKDPESTPAAHREKAVKKFSHELEQKTLISKQLSPTLRDSLFYLWLENWDLNKPIHYFVVIGLESILPRSLSGLKHTFLKETWCSALEQRGWKQRLALNVDFFTVGMWQKHFPDCPLVRITEAENEQIDSLGE